MTLQANRRLFTVEEYHKLLEVGILKEEDRVELINGDIIKMSPVNSTHAGMVDALVEYLILKLHKKACIKCQNPVIITERSEPEPDIVIATYKSDNYRSAHPIPSDIHFIIEVSDSTLAYDQTIKAKMYAQADIAEYWIINLVDQQIEVYRQPQNGQYHLKQIFSATTQIESSSIDFSISYSDIFQ